MENFLPVLGVIIACIGYFIGFIFGIKYAVDENLTRKQNGKIDGYPFGRNVVDSPSQNAQVYKRLMPIATDNSKMRGEVIPAETTAERVAKIFKTDDPVQL